jgi:predicted peroxiredoxin
LAGLNKGDITTAFDDMDERERKVVKIVKVEDVIPAHQIKLETDYDRVKQMALNKKRNEMIEKFVNSKLPTTFISIDGRYDSCNLKPTGKEIQLKIIIKTFRTSEGFLCPKSSENRYFYYFYSMSSFIDFNSAKKLHQMNSQQNKITQLFNIQYPIIQAGMIWHSGWKLASAVSNCGGLGLIGAGSMYPDILRENIQKCKQATDKPFGVNVPMLYPNLDEVIQIILEEGVKIVFTSAGNPKTYTETLQKEGLKVAHVVSSTKFAMKCEEAGVDAVVAEGFEAGGHNGRDETTTFCLIPM